MANADLTRRVKIFEADRLEERDINDTFAQRAESYYRKQPKLLSLLHDLYNAYLSLSDRYIHTLTRKNHKVEPSRPSIDVLDPEEMESDAESSLSYQRLPSTPNNGDQLLAELVMKTAEREFMIHELGIIEQKGQESSKKIRIQRSLLEVLEAERNILLNQNKSLGDKVGMLEEENRELALESNLIRSQANDLARCVLELKEEESVGRLLCTIDDLHDRVQWLEKTNMEYYELIMKGGQGDEVAPRGCFQVGRLKGKEVKKGKSEKWWWKAKNIKVEFKLAAYRSPFK